MTKLDDAKSRMLLVNDSRSGIDLNVDPATYRRASMSRIARLGVAFFGCLIVLVASACAATRIQEGAAPPHWIWFPMGAGLNEVPAETRYFRKTFEVKEPSRLSLEVTADNSFTLYLDGNKVAEGAQWQNLEAFETKLASGRHVLAAVASNEAPGPVGFLLRGGVLPPGQGVPIHTDSSWKTAGAVPPGEVWTRAGFDDSKWASAADLGPLGIDPWGMPASRQNAAERFRVPQGFSVSMAASAGVTGSVVAFTFDPRGIPCVAIEQGPIARLIDDDNDGRYDRREVIETPVRNCQGLSFIRGRLFAVGDGPAGAGLYRLGDADKDGVFEQCELVRAADGGMGEHGPHAVGMGPDGRLYYINGNHAHLKPPIEPSSPVNIAYEGELLPHFDDARGHAAGVMAPGGEILRSDDDGKTWQRIVAGFRNEYDFAFNTDGELFSFDSDMEWDVGLPWYRPVRVNHCPIGADFGWRNGSGKWPPYYVDSLPAVLDVGRGSPTGVTFYQANQFPSKYHDNFLICDWSQGRIMAIALKREGASYAASSTELVSGQPLNCTDIEVGPDGSVYFSTGGRGTQGGLFRVSWSEAKPAVRSDHPLNDALQVDSPLSSFSQERIRAIQTELGPTWGLNLIQMARVDGRSSIRVRALELLAQFGPAPGDELLIEFASNQDSNLRARAVGLLGARSSRPARDALVKALEDKDPFVRRHACESLMQQPAATIPVPKLLPLLDDPDRWIRFAARVAIEHGDVREYRSRILAIREPRALVGGMVALVRSAALDEKQQDEIRGGAAALLTAGPRLEPDLACDTLRLIELTYLLGPRKTGAADSAALKAILLGLFSTDVDSPFNREAARLLAFFGEPKAVAALLEHQARSPDLKAQIHDAYCLRAMKRGWGPESKSRLWAWYQAASVWDGGYSFQGYLDMMIQDLVALLDQAERAQYLAQGDKFPFPTRVLVRSLDLESFSRSVPALTALYDRLRSGTRTEMKSDLQALIVEKLGSTPRPEAHVVLREFFRLDSENRERIVRALAAHPAQEDLAILVSGLDSRDAGTTDVWLSTDCSGSGRCHRAPTAWPGCSGWRAESDRGWRVCSMTWPRGGRDCRPPQTRKTLSSCWPPGRPFTARGFLTAHRLPKRKRPPKIVTRWSF